MASAVMAPPAPSSASTASTDAAAGSKQQKQQQQPDIAAILKKSGMRALGGGLSGAAAMGINVGALMWLRTVRCVFGVGSSCRWFCEQVCVVCARAKALVYSQKGTHEWMHGRTQTINYQYRNGTTMSVALRTLYKVGS